MVASFASTYPPLSTHPSPPLCRFNLSHNNSLRIATLTFHARFPVSLHIYGKAVMVFFYPPPVQFTLMAVEIVSATPWTAVMWRKLLYKNICTLCHRSSSSASPWRREAQSRGFHWPLVWTLFTIILHNDDWKQGVFKKLLLLLLSVLNSLVLIWSLLQ